MEEKSWRRKHGGEIREEKSGRRNYGGEILEEKSWRSNHGGHLEAEAPRRHPGGLQDAPRRHPGRTPGGPQEAPRATQRLQKHTKSTQRHPGICQETRRVFEVNVLKP